MGLGQGDWREPKPDSGARGFAMAALLVGLSVMAVLMGAALPVWSQQMKREREEELIWRGQQYARAVGLFQRKYANTFPPTIDILVEQRFLRKKYKDPITNSDFQPIPAGGGVPGQGGVPPPPSGPQGPGAQRQGATPPTGFTIQTRPDNGGTNTANTMGQGSAPSIGIQGVVSKSKDSSIKIYNGRNEVQRVGVRLSRDGTTRRRDRRISGYATGYAAARHATSRTVQSARAEPCRAPARPVSLWAGWLRLPAAAPRVPRFRSAVAVCATLAVWCADAAW